LFSILECKYDLRDLCKFTVQKTKKEIKRRCISIVGVQLWNIVKMDIRMGNSFLVFKRIIKKNMYMEDVCGYIYIYNLLFSLLFYFILYKFSDLFDYNIFFP